MKRILSLAIFSLTACSTTQIKPESHAAVEIVKKYYAAYNESNAEAEAALMTADVVHEPNQGTSTVGKEHYFKFSKDLKDAYKEKCVNIKYLTGENPNHVVAESTVEGVYAKDVKGYPKANGQTYNLRVVESFEIKDAKISRISTFYNEQEWIRQISPKKKK